MVTFPGDDGPRRERPTPQPRGEYQVFVAERFDAVGSYTLTVCDTEAEADAIVAEHTRTGLRAASWSL